MDSVLIMAGGQSSRMRNSTNLSTHKALVTVFDIPLIELNLLYAYVFGYKKIWISVSASEPDLITYVRFLQPIYKQRFGVEIQVIIEEIPLGTIGAAQFVETEAESLLILNVDNLLDLDLSALTYSHTKSQADMTIASHEEPFQIPFGQLVVRDERVIDYLEKPVNKILVSSGTYIIGCKARNIISSHYFNKRLDIPELSKTLIEKKLCVHSFFHESHWYDVNDKETLFQLRETEQWPLIEEISKLKRELV